MRLVWGTLARQATRPFANRKSLWQNEVCRRCLYLLTIDNHCASLPNLNYDVKNKLSHTSSSISTRLLSTSAVWLKVRKVKMPPKPTIDENDIEEKFIKGGGKGGQKINKTNSKVQLRHIPTGIVVSSQFTRSLTENRKDARKKLALAVDSYLYGDASWQAVRADKIRKKISRAKQKSKANNLTKIAQKHLEQELDANRKDLDELFQEWQLNRAIQPSPQLQHDQPLDLEEMLSDLKQFAIAKGKPDAFDGFIQEYRQLYKTSDPDTTKHGEKRDVE